MSTVITVLEAIERYRLMSVMFYLASSFVLLAVVEAVRQRRRGK